MDWSLVIFGVIVVFFVYRGYRNGLLRSCSRVSSLLAGYACAILFTGPLSRVIESLLQLRGIVAFIVAALLLFIGASVAVSLLFRVLLRIRAERESESRLSAVGGAAVGLVVGVLIAVVVVWVFAFVRDLQPARDPGFAMQPRPSSGVEKLVNRAAGRAIGKVMSLGSSQPVVVQLSAAVIESPAATAQHAKNLMQSGDFIALFGRPENRRVLDSGNARAVQQLPEFQRLLANPDLLALAESAGLPQMASDAGQSTEAALAQQLSDIWVRAQEVKHEPRVQAILQDETFLQKVHAGNPLALMTDDRFLELADIIFSERAAPDSPTGSTETTTGSSTPAAEPVEPRPVFRWTDDQGRVHYSDVEPGS